MMTTMQAQPFTSWSEKLADARRQLVDRNRLERGFRAFLPERIAKVPHWTALQNLQEHAIDILLVLGAAQLRAELAPIAHIVSPAVENYLGFQQHDEGISSALLNFASTACLYESVGMDLGPEVLASLRPFLIRVMTSGSDPDFRSWHWNRGLIALVLDEPNTWRSIAGLVPDEPLVFQPGAVFQFNMQGLLRHLAAAVEHRADVADVLPAWKDLIRCAPLMWSASPQQADEFTCLWAARLVHHHIGGNPLGTVGDFLYREVHAVREVP